MCLDRRRSSCYGRPGAAVWIRSPVDSYVGPSTAQGRQRGLQMLAAGHHVRHGSARWRPELSLTKSTPDLLEPGGTRPDGAGRRGARSRTGTPEGDPATRADRLAIDAEFIRPHLNH